MAHCRGRHPGGFSVSPDKETPQPPWMTCSSHPHSNKLPPHIQPEPPTLQFVPFASMSCHWAQLKRAWFYLLDTLPSDIYAH